MDAPTVVCRGAYLVIAVPKVLLRSVVQMSKIASLLWNGVSLVVAFITLLNT